MYIIVMSYCPQVCLGPILSKVREVVTLSPDNSPAPLWQGHMAVVRGHVTVVCSQVMRRVPHQGMAPAPLTVRRGHHKVRRAVRLSSLVLSTHRVCPVWAQCLTHPPQVRQCQRRETVGQCWWPSQWSRAGWRLLDGGKWQSPYRADSFAFAG